MSYEWLLLFQQLSIPKQGFCESIFNSKTTDSDQELIENLDFFANFELVENLELLEAQTNLSSENGKANQTPKQLPRTTKNKGT